jgi:hypothetical protein
VSDYSGPNSSDLWQQVDWQLLCLWQQLILAADGCQHADAGIDQLTRAANQTLLRSRHQVTLHNCIWNATVLKFDQI